MTYEVIKRFVDLQDNNHVYNVGDTYPRDGARSTESRCNELASTANKRGVPLIKVAEIAAADVTEDIADEVEPAVDEDAEDKPKRGRKKAD